MPPDLINSPQKKALSNSKKAIRNAQIMPDNKNGVLPKAKADKADKNNISLPKKIGIKIKEEIMEVNKDVKNDFSKKLQNNLQKESLIQETTKKTKSVTKKRKLINIKEENDSSLNQSPNNNNVAANEFNPLDNILNEIDAFDTSNKPKNKKKREKLIKIESPSDVESGNAPCSSQQLPPTPLPSSANRPLNKIELARQEHDNSMVQTFLHKDDLMERILAYKMLRGRVESYLTMKAKIDLNTCITPEYEIRPDLVDPVSDRLHPKLEAIIKQESNEAIEEEEHPLPPPFPPPPLFDSSSSFVPPPPPSLIPSEGALSQALHGPMTPSGSPGTNQSSLSANNGNNQQQKNHQQEIFPCTSDTLMTNEEMVPPPKQPKLEKSESNSTNEELFKKFGGLPEHQISTFFGVDLKKYGDLQFDELLATFRESLAKHLSEKEKKKQESSSKSPAASGGHVERLQPQQRQQQTSQEQQSLLNVSNELEAAMEISSTSSSSLGVFLPPPPAPPPMLYNNNSMPSTSREAVEDEGKSPVLVSDTSISPQQQIKPPTPLFPQGQQLVFTRPPPPFSTTIIPKGKPLPISQNQLPQQFLHPPPQIETGGRCQILISESSIFQPQQQKRPPSLFSQVPLVFSTPPPFIPTTTMVTPFTTPPPRFPHRQRLPPPSQHQQQFLHPPPRPLLSCKEAEVKETKNSILSPDSIIIPQHKQQKLPSLFSKCQLVFPRPPPIPTSLAAPPQLPLNHHPPQQLHSSTLSRETSGNEAKSRILSPESTITPQQRLPPPPPFPQVPLVFTTPPPPIPATTPRVASPQIPPLHQQTPQSQQFLHPPSSVPSQNDILKTVVQAINIGKSKENNKVKCSISPEKDDPATTTVEGNTKPYGKFF